MAKKKRRRAAGRRKADQRKPGWLWMLMGLLFGFGIATVVYFTDIRGTGTAIAISKPPVAVKTLVLPEASKKPKAEKEPPEDAGITFDFYEMLPNLDVEVYEEKKPVAPKPVPVKKTPPPASVPGIYILQAGSFSTFADANRRKAQIALLGVRAEIKKGLAGSKTVYRVYTNPLETPTQVNSVSKKLNNANIEVLRKRVSD
jgi:cell division protein FtsN